MCKPNQGVDLIVHAEHDWKQWFASRAEAESHAAKYCQDYRYEIIERPPEEFTFGDERPF